MNQWRVKQIEEAEDRVAKRVKSKPKKNMFMNVFKKHAKTSAGKKDPNINQLDEIM